MVELTVVLVTVLGGTTMAVTVKPSDSSGASSPLYRDTSRCFLPRRFIPFIPFLPSPCLSLSTLSVSQSISPVFVFLSFGRFSLSLGFPPIFYCFSSFPLPFFPLVWVVFIRERGARLTLPRPIAARAWCARCLLFPGADSGGQWRRSLRGTAALASHHEMCGI